MSKRFTRTEILERLNKEIAEKKPLYMPNCGCGLTGKLQEMGGADIITVSPTSYLRFKGLPSRAAMLPVFDINQIVFDLASEINAMVKDTPLISLSESHNPLFPHKDHLEKLWSLGISGVTPIMSGGISEEYSRLVDEIGIGFKREVEFIRTAREMEMFTFAYAFNPEEARILADAGADVISAHMGTSIGGLAGQTTELTLEQSVVASQKIFSAAREVNPDVILFTHGGPIITPKDAAFIYENTDANGFVGGSAGERIPIEEAVLEVTKQFKSYK